MSFLRYDNILGPLGAGRSMGFLAGQQWRNGPGRGDLVVQLVPAGLGHSRPLDRSTTGKMDTGHCGTKRGGHYLRGLDYSFAHSFAVNRK